MDKEILRSHSLKKINTNTNTNTNSNTTNTHHETPKRKYKVGELLAHTANLMISPDNLTISNDKLKLIAENEHYNDSDGDNSTIHSLSSSHYQSHSWHAGHSSPGRGSSVADSFSVGSEYSMHSRTNRELIEEIKKRAMKNRAPPEYVPSMDSLDPSMLSWNKKLPKEFNKEDPPVNIIGCMHSLELVLAKADKRLRKRAKTLKIRQQKCDERTKAIDDSIKWNFSSRTICCIISFKTITIEMDENHDRYEIFILCRDTISI